MSNEEPLIERIIRILESYVLGDRQEECAEKIISEFQSSDVTKEVYEVEEVYKAYTESEWLDRVTFKEYLKRTYKLIKSTQDTNDKK